MDNLQMRAITESFIFQFRTGHPDCGSFSHFDLGSHERKIFMKKSSLASKLSVELLEQNTGDVNLSQCHPLICVLPLSDP
jgi:hypothetical protein